MHELSIIQSIIQIAAERLQSEIDPKVEEVVLEIGDLAGIEVSSLSFLWSAAVENTILAGAKCHIQRVKGMAQCSECDSRFHVRQYYDPCPHCGSHLYTILQGNEMKVKSVTLAD